jgi:hypothetical protein
MSAKKNQQEFNAIVQDLKAKIKQTLIDTPPYEGFQSDEWLRTLYKSYTNKFIHDNNRIWTTGSIMIPLSLAAFAAVPTINCPKSIHLLILGLASLTIIISWLVIAENHRAFQDKSLAWVVAIEEVLGLTGTGGTKIRGNPLNRLLTFPAAVQIMRWSITSSITIGWILVLILWPRCI